MMHLASPIGVLVLSLAAALQTPACKKSTPPADETVPEALDVVDAGAAPDEHPLAKAVREDFGKKFSCPEDRVLVKVRADIDPVKALAPNRDFSIGTPPDEVKADPGRYEKWKADREKQIESERATYANRTMFEVSGCGHTQIRACRAHHIGGAVYPDWADCTDVASSAPALTLANLGTATVGSKWTPLEGAPDIVGDASAFDPVANYDWASGIAAAWSPDARLYHLSVGSIPPGGTVDLSPSGKSGVSYHFNSTSKGDVDFSLEVDPLRDRPRDGAGVTVQVMVAPHRDPTPRVAVPKPACTLARALAVVRSAGTLAKANPRYPINATLVNKGKSRWYVAYAVGDGPTGVEDAVNATTCAIEHPK